MYSLTSSKVYLETTIKTADYILCEMTSPEGGFYSAQDADSEGDGKNDSSDSEGRAPAIDFGRLFGGAMRMHPLPKDGAQAKNDKKTAKKKPEHNITQVAMHNTERIAPLVTYEESHCLIQTYVI